MKLQKCFYIIIISPLPSPTHYSNTALMTITHHYYANQKNQDFSPNKVCTNLTLSFGVVHKLR